MPTDTKGRYLVYMSRATGSWDVYVASINGGGGTNLTNHPTDDGPGIISPDGQWVAFVSNRDGHLGVWVVPITGGTAQHLPIDIPGWIGSYGRWTVERVALKGLAKDLAARYQTAGEMADVLRQAVGTAASRMLPL